jgi:hypothetical protein
MFSRVSGLLGKPPSMLSRLPFALFFSNSALPNPFKVRDYPCGTQITPIAAKKQWLLTQLQPSPSFSSQLNRFVETLFDRQEATRLIKLIDAEADAIVAKQFPTLFCEYMIQTPVTMDAWLQTNFLPALQKIIEALATLHRFKPENVVRLHDILLDDHLMEDYISKGKLIIDMGEDGHGPLPHVIAAFMMGRLELEGKLGSAEYFYQSLASRTRAYCPERNYFRHQFSLLLDATTDDAMFANPASLANHLLQHCHSLGKLASICRMHSKALLELSQQECVIQDRHFQQKFR